MPLKSRGFFSLPSRHRGFTLIEIMVAVVVLAIGLLGLAGLQATSLRFNNSAYHRSQATNLAYDIVDRMRVNRQRAIETPTGTVEGYDGWACNDPPACVAGLVPAGTTLAEQDMEAWCNALACTLPLGTGGITRTGNVFTISIQWDDDRDGVLNPPFDMDTEL